jgi:predicted metal-dependent phosphoesterase TrpH
MGKADLHIHTSEGDGLDSLEAILEHVEAATDLDVVAITEHDNVRVSLRARDLRDRRGYGFEVVTGAEVTTLDGHVIALFIEEPLPSFRRVEETVEAVRKQGGVCFIPHPMSWLTRSIGTRTMARLARQTSDGPWFDAIELATCNPTSFAFLKKARRLNDQQYRLPVVGASDAHFTLAIGSSHTVFEGETAADLRTAFSQGAVSGEVGCFPRLRDIGYLRALSVPLVGLRATPRRLGWRRTAWSFVSRYVS